MSSYDEYVDNLTRLVQPHPVPKYMPVSYAAMLGRPIAAASVEDEALCVRFVGGGALRIWDNGQACCESRYMTTDDDLPSFVGAKVVSLEAVKGPDISCEEWSYNEFHEQMFVKLETTAGTITLVTHNEHSGYYGGFDVETRWED